jgi:hypothetical protein
VEASATKQGRSSSAGSAEGGARPRLASPPRSVAEVPGFHEPTREERAAYTREQLQADRPPIHPGVCRTDEWRKYVSRLNPQGDELSSYWEARPDMRRDMWNRFHMRDGGWGLSLDQTQSMGWELPTNTTYPLARTFNALAFLAWGATDQPSCAKRSALPQYAYCWAGDAIDELWAGCGDVEDTAAARTFTGLATDDRVELYLPFFYKYPVPVRASTIVHEARHAEGCPHNHGTQDVAYRFGCSDTSGQYGAWSWTINYLKALLGNDRPGFVTDTSRQQAQAFADTAIVLGFMRSPCWRVGPDGRRYEPTDARSVQQKLQGLCGDD